MTKLMTKPMTKLDLYRSDDRKKTKGKETIGYAERVSERIVICGTKEKGRKQERVENMEAKNLPHGRTITTKLKKSNKVLLISLSKIQAEQKCSTSEFKKLLINLTNLSVFEEVQITGQVSLPYDAIAFGENQLTCVE